MHHKSTLILSATVLTVALAGCESHQAKVDSLQKEYDSLEAQFRKDCTAEYLKVPPTLSPKCSDERKQADDTYKRLQTERTKQ